MDGPQEKKERKRTQKRFNSLVQLLRREKCKPWHTLAKRTITIHRDFCPFLLTGAKDGERERNKQRWEGR